MNDLKKIAKEIRNCRKCRLWKHRKNAVPGEGPENAKVMLVGEAPGREEDNLGRPFVGMSGKFLTKELERAGLKREKMFVCGIIRCRPPKNRKPRSDEVKACLPYFERQVSVIKPNLIVILGDVALKSILGGKYSITRDHGKLIGKYFIMPHPSAAMRFPKIRRIFRKDLRKLKRLIKL